MSEILIDRQFMLHEGGTKFYQVMRVKRASVGTGGIAATVTNWGIYSGEPGLRRFQDRGQRKLEMHDAYVKTITAKKARGYDPKARWGDSQRFTADQAWDFLVSELGSTEAEKVREIVGFVPGSMLGKLKPTTAPDDTPIPPRTARVSESAAAAASMDGWGDF